jgi:hypothetical protein
VYTKVNGDGMDKSHNEPIHREKDESSVLLGQSHGHGIRSSTSMECSSG